MWISALGVFTNTPHFPPFDHRFIDVPYKFFVDRALADFSNDEHFSFVVGAFDNTLMGWHDKDVPIVGGQLSYSDEDVSVLDNFGAKLLYHCGQPWLDESDSKLIAFELEGGKKLAGDWTVVGNMNYMHWFDMDPDFNRTNTNNTPRLTLLIAVSFLYADSIIL